MHDMAVTMKRQTVQKRRASHEEGRIAGGMIWSEGSEGRGMCDLANISVFFISHSHIRGKTAIIRTAGATFCGKLSTALLSRLRHDDRGKFAAWNCLEKTLRERKKQWLVQGELMVPSYLCTLETLLFYRFGSSSA
jgi:hypothetical protein